MAAAIAAGMSICIGPVPVQIVIRQPSVVRSGIHPCGTTTRNSSAQAISASDTICGMPRRIRKAANIRDQQWRDPDPRTRMQ